VRSRCLVAARCYVVGYTAFTMMRVFIVGLLVVWLLPQSVYAFSQARIVSAIRVIFPDVPEMVDVARCESGLRQYTDAGSVLRGGLGGQMIGLFQFHERYHRAAAAMLGFDIDTLVGNLLYARSLYRAQGLTPWRSSQHCWGERDDTSGGSQRTLTATLRFGAQNAQVHVLQARLQERGYLETPRVPGRFGVPTYLALVRFQCDAGIACLGDEATRMGVGVTTAETRAALNTR